MAQGNHFLTIPKQEGLFTTIKSGRGEDNGDNSPVEDEDEEETEEEVRFIPRCSPVPRKRGPSITDETAEYMRIRLALQRRVSFADATGGELVDVREFAAFDSGDDENNADWEEEEAKCRRAYLEPVYRVWPEFQARDESDLMPAVRAGKVEVEKVTPVQNQPLSFDAIICVLNVSYHKRVYVRSTMDGWITCTDSVAEYVQGSHDGDTDRFSVRLSFSEPYLFNGARIDFVVRYETSEGEFWANNSGRNYSVTLVVSYEEDTRQDNKVDDQEIKGILKPSRFSGEDDSDFYQDTDDGNDDDDDAERETVAEIPSTMSPLIIKPEIDIEIPEALISPSKAREDPTQAECPPLSTDSQEEHTLQDSSENPPQSDHLEKDQGTELLIPAENKTGSIQNEAPDNNPTSNSDRYSMHSVEGSQAVCPSQDSHQSDTAVQAPVDLGITIPATYSSIQEMKEDHPEELKDHRENDGIQSGEGRVTELQDQNCVTMEVDSTESSSQELPESTQHHSVNEVMAASANKGKEDFSLSTGHDILFEESHKPLLENPEFQMINLDTMVRRETNGKAQVNLKAGEVPDMITSCVHQPFEPPNLGRTREDCVIQNVPSTPGTPDRELTKNQQQGQGPEPELKRVPDVLSVSVDTPFISESISPQELSPILIPLASAPSSSQSSTITVQTVAPGDGDGQPGSESTILNEATQMLTPLSSAISLSQSSTTTMQTMASEDGDGEPSMKQDEPLSNKEFELYYHDPVSFHKKEGLETQPALPCRNFEASNVETGVILGKTLIPSFAFLSATVCLIVGFHEPSIFLIMALFLVSLCF